MKPTETFIIVALGSSLLMIGLWSIQYRQRNATIVDVGWSCGLFVTVLFFVYTGGGDPLRRVLLLLLAGGWSARLSWYLFRDRVLRKWHVEDGRYARMRKAMGKREHLGFFLFFQLQAGFVILFSLPLFPVSVNSRPLGALDLIGVMISLIAIVGEWMSDRQLAAFRGDPKNANRTCKEGLWLYSRHPNYFFESVHWIAYIPLAVGHPLWYIALFGPFVMAAFILFVTGVPYTEQQAASHRPDYAEYQQTTNAFIPWFPKAKS